MIKIVRHYLEIRDIAELNFVKKPNNKCFLEKISPPDFQLNKFFYKQIGKNHRWIDRLSWTDSQWMNGALNYATGMKNEDHTQSGINDNYNAEDWTPDHTLSIFSNNTKKASCCATSAYSVNSACPCITSEQFNYLSSRGGNHSNGDI